MALALTSKTTAGLELMLVSDARGDEFPGGELTLEVAELESAPGNRIATHMSCVGLPVESIEVGGLSSPASVKLEAGPVPLDVSCTLSVTADVECRRVTDGGVSELELVVELDVDPGPGETEYELIVAPEVTLAPERAIIDPCRVK